jgi:antitoxin YefM
LNAVTMKEAELNLKRLAKQVIEDAEPTIVVMEGGDGIVLVPLDDYNSWKETLYLLSNPANADHLRRSIAEAEAGKAQERELLEE